MVRWPGGLPTGDRGGGGRPPPPPPLDEYGPACVENDTGRSLTCRGAKGLVEPGLEGGPPL